jgi:hypothetical protein
MIWCPLPRRRAGGRSQITRSISRSQDRKIDRQIITSQDHEFPNARFDQHAEMAQRTARWSYRELAAPHHPSVTMPGQVAELLLDLAS